MCVDETMMQWLNATRAGKKPNIDRVGLSYMLMGEARFGALRARGADQLRQTEFSASLVLVSRGRSFA
jgi:hypothetical protein